MSAAGRLGESRDTDAVQAAARLSLQARGVRMYRARVREADAGWSEPWSWEEGFADPAARAARLRFFYAQVSPWVKLGEAVPRRWPWLAGDDPSGISLQDGGEEIEIGRKRFWGSEGRWIDWSSQPCDGPGRALWPLEVMLGATSASRAEDAEARGTTCARYAVVVSPTAAAGRDDVLLVDPPGASEGWRTVHADICIDDRGLIRRIAWSPAFEKRRRRGLLDRPTMTVGGDPSREPHHTGRLWHVTELWDYGRSVDIVAPTEPVDPQGGPPLREIVYDLWRMRREYKRRKH